MGGQAELSSLPIRVLALKAIMARGPKKHMKRLAAPIGCWTSSVGTVVNRERHPGSFDIVHVRDAVGHTFATRLNNIFIIGKVNKAWVSLPRGKGVKLTIAEERDRRFAQKS